MKILDKIGMCPAYCGYIYWEYAIKYTNKKYPDIYAVNITKIYKLIAKKFNVTVTSVERNMRTAKDNIKKINLKLQVDYKITNKKALILLTRRYRSDKQKTNKEIKYGRKTKENR